ncbi:MAG TPA: protein kinase [Gemmataceae bacterium]|nr:protein kinase [Gemmataceae bacterium]
MQVVCGKCGKVLEYSGDCPSFCAYCGQALAEVNLNTPSGFDPEGLTQVGSGRGGQATALRTLGGYTLMRELGSGGMGAVYEAEETASGRRVAVKLITPEFAGAGDAVDRFRQEGRIASMVAHPRCVFVLSVDEEAGQPYIVMELMPGSTLKDLVDRQGPLAPEDAIAKILDVIEGLQAAHRLEVIHRDVKPSNCFLEPDGRVKVGDFGLAKSLVKDAHLTKTGAFVGTPHFASPEQIKSEPIDQQTDVYSVAATLYYLLTGKPPFWGSDSAATLARIVSDPAPPLRSLRPELSPALEQVVLRGLDRDRKIRWPDLESFRQALVALVPERLSLAGLGLRFGAFVVDLALLLLVSVSVQTVLTALFASSLQVRLLGRAVDLCVFLLYFTILEHVWGCSLGKGMLGLRVCTTRWIDPPGWPAAFVRTAIFCCLIPLGALVSALVLALVPGNLAVGQIDILLTCGWAALGLAILGLSMRRSDIYQGLHEVASATRVVQLARPKQREHLLQGGGWLLSFLQSRRLNQGMPASTALPDRLAGFAVRGALKWSAGEKVLLGEDASLGRRVFIWLRPISEPPLDRTRRDIGRRTRLRWLACGKQGDLQWDAILAPLGCPLPELIQSEGTLSWHDARTLLEDLAGELTAACAEGTLPKALSPAQVWVQADGRAQLADTPLTASAADDSKTGGGDQERALSLLAQVATRALEGKLLVAGATVQAALPANGRKVLDRLLGNGPHYELVAQFQSDLGLTSGGSSGISKISQQLAGQSTVGDEEAK